MAVRQTFLTWLFARRFRRAKLKPEQVPVLAMMGSEPLRGSRFTGHLRRFGMDAELCGGALLGGASVIA